MQNTGEIVAVDKFENRLDVLKKNIERMGITNIRTVAVDSLKFNENEFDRVLADVPCSGLGTLTKKPDIKWKKDLGDIRKLNEIQLKLLQKASTLVKVNGILVYSTCTTEPEENIEIVNKFLSSDTNFD